MIMIRQIGCLACGRASMRKISFDFDHKKATQAINFFALKQGGHINEMKALKLIYFADRYHLRKYGRLVTNDTYFAMDNGPVPSGAKDIAEGSSFLGKVEKEYSAGYLKKKDSYTLFSLKPLDTGVFSDSDIEALNFAWERFGKFGQFDLAKLTHRYPEWSKHESSLRNVASRKQMNLTDFLDDPTKNAEKCFALTDEDRTLRREQIEEMAELEALWS
jgi:uncharacterized phage-associated protein